jgi:uncharacterized protein (TIGR03435 family)
MKLLAHALLLALPAFAQTFEVISVKSHSTVGRGFQGVQPTCADGHFRATTPLELTIRWAYDLSQQQTSELATKLPQWARGISGSYDLEATTHPEVTEEQCKKMTQHLFEDRFHLKFHLDTVEAKVYELVPARAGFKMPPANPDDSQSNVSVTVNGRQLPFPAESPFWKGVSMDELAQFLVGINPGRLAVIDKTGIPGRYKLKITYSGAAAATREFADPDLFTAIEQQLGLKLEDARGPVAHFVLESIEKPGEN